MLYEHWAHLGSLRSYRTIVNLYCYGIIGTPASTCGMHTQGNNKVRVIFKEKAEEIIVFQ